MRFRAEVSGDVSSHPSRGPKLAEALPRPSLPLGCPAASACRRSSSVLARGTHSRVLSLEESVGVGPWGSARFHSYMDSFQERDGWPLNPQVSNLWIQPWIENGIFGLWLGTQDCGGPLCDLLWAASWEGLECPWGPGTSPCGF